LYDPTAGVWTGTGGMRGPHRFHTSTLLANGKVLVSGGYIGGTSITNGAELYDPVSGTWTATGSMNTTREDHTSTLLPNGQVLVAGGDNSTNDNLASVELYNPTTGTWMSTSALSTARTYHTATLLPSGKVLVAGGEQSGSIPLASAELYDPVSGTWTNTGALNYGRWSHTAALLPNGKVLVAGGASAAPLSEIYDPATGTWSPSGTMVAPRTLHTTTLLPNDGVLVAGGVNADLLPSAELYDVGLGFSASRQPQIVAFTSPLNLSNSLALAGSRFRGVSEGSGGNGAQDSPSDCPVVQLRAIESGQMLFLSSTDWQTNSYSSAPVTSFPPGYALLTMFVNGIPSASSVLRVAPTPMAILLTNAKKLPNGAFQFGFTNTPGAVFSALAATNVALPLSNWTALTGVTEISSGQFQFTDTQATNYPHRFYRGRSP